MLSRGDRPGCRFRVRARRGFPARHRGPHPSETPIDGRVGRIASVARSRGVVLVLEREDELHGGAAREEKRDAREDHRGVRRRDRGWLCGSQRRARAVDRSTPGDR